MKIGVIGAGAVGLYYGARLQQGGQEVHFLLRRDYQAIRAGGLRVFSVNGDFELPQVNAWQRPEEMGTVDLVLIALKAFANDRLAELVTPLVGPQTMLLTLQNGLGNEERLAELFGAERVIGGIAFICSNRGEPGTVHHLGVGHIQIADLAPGRPMARVEALAELFSACGIPCRAMPDLARIRWEKLVWNIPFNGLCALTRLPTDALLAHPPSRQLVLELMREVIAAGNAQGLNRPVAADFADRMIAATEPMGPYRPSMMIDRLEGRPLELEAIYREPLRRAAARGVAMPRTEMLAALLELEEPRSEA